jgi:carboxymethylenebutenolidase
MGQRVEFPSNGHTCQGYFAAPSGKGPAIVVIQEWWGLVPHIEDLVERFAAEGFVAIAPDLFHGKTTKSPDEAGKMLMEMDAEQALKEISGAGSYLLQRPECSSKTFGVIGFCMGGAMAKYAATKDKKVSAGVSFYGGFKKVDYDWQNMSAALMLVAGKLDRGVPAQGEVDLAERLHGLGKNVEVHTYENADHAFFNDTRPEVYNQEASADAWRRTLDFFRANVR